MNVVDTEEHSAAVGVIVCALKPFTHSGVGVGIRQRPRIDNQTDGLNARTLAALSPNPLVLDRIKNCADKLLIVIVSPLHASHHTSKRLAAPRNAPQIVRMEVGQDGDATLRAELSNAPKLLVRNRPRHNNNAGVRLADTIVLIYFRNAPSFVVRLHAQPTKFRFRVIKAPPRVNLRQISVQTQCRKTLNAVYIKV